MARQLHSSSSNSSAELLRLGCVRGATTVQKSILRSRQSVWLAIFALAALVETYIAKASDAPDTKTAVARERNPRVLFITSKDSPQCDKELSRLRQPSGEFEKMRAAGWTIGTGPDKLIQIVDRDEVAELVDKMDVHE